ncbi:hypothetical protein BJ875DRAFT_483483 [Amylocarpus encephaloides]|uniref:Uncharacterized protein n=1 Tax=Amylocarpus encephaloides TaxID=45428 RepID=A0A9P8C6F3_9HELO|nr:hypothetical protein BJ875DRAFT_483483 [Amylocarpus encephaloides]
MTNEEQTRAFANTFNLTEAWIMSQTAQQMGETSAQPQVLSHIYAQEIGPAPSSSKTLISPPPQKQGSPTQIMCCANVRIHRSNALQRVPDTSDHQDLRHIIVEDFRKYASGKLPDRVEDPEVPVPWDEYVYIYAIAQHASRRPRSCKDTTIYAVTEYHGPELVQIPEEKWLTIIGMSMVKTQYEKCLVRQGGGVEYSCKKHLDTVYTVYLCEYRPAKPSPVQPLIYPQPVRARGRGRPLGVKNGEGQKAQQQRLSMPPPSRPQTPQQQTSIKSPIKKVSNSMSMAQSQLHSQPPNPPQKQSTSKPPSIVLPRQPENPSTPTKQTSKKGTTTAPLKTPSSGGKHAGTLQQLMAKTATPPSKFHSQGAYLNKPTGRADPMYATAEDGTALKKCSKHKKYKVVGDFDICKKTGELYGHCRSCMGGYKGR